MWRCRACAAPVVYRGSRFYSQPRQTLRQPLHASLGKESRVRARGCERAIEFIIVAVRVVIEERFWCSHRRAKPKTLRKKLAKIVWKPSVRATTPGVTRRTAFPGAR